MNISPYIPIAEGKRIMHELYEALRNSPDMNTTILQEDLPSCPRCDVKVPLKYGMRSGRFTAWHPNTDCPISWQQRFWMPTEQEAIEAFVETWK